MHPRGHSHGNGGSHTTYSEHSYLAGSGAFQERALLSCQGNHRGHHQELVLINLLPLQNTNLILYIHSYIFCCICSVLFIISTTLEIRNNFC